MKPELHYRSTQDPTKPGPCGTQVFVSAYIGSSTIYGFSRTVPFCELPAELMGADEETFLTHPWTVTNLIPDAIENAKAHIAEAMKALGAAS